MAKLLISNLRDKVALTETRIYFTFLLTYENIVNDKANLLCKLSRELSSRASDSSSYIHGIEKILLNL